MILAHAMVSLLHDLCQQRELLLCPEQEERLRGSLDSFARNLEQAMATTAQASHLGRLRHRAVVLLGSEEAAGALFTEARGAPGGGVDYLHVQLGALEAGLRTAASGPVSLESLPIRQALRFFEEPEPEERLLESLRLADMLTAPPRTTRPRHAGPWAPPVVPPAPRRGSLRHQRPVLRPRRAPRRRG